jgi:hypothetical protein
MREDRQYIFPKGRYLLVYTRIYGVYRNEILICINAIILTAAIS